MAGTRKTSGGRPHVIAVRLSDEEKAVVDAARGSLSQSAWVRLMLLDFRKNLPKV